MKSLFRQFLEIYILGLGILISGVYLTGNHEISLGAGIVAMAFYSTRQRKEKL